MAKKHHITLATTNYRSLFLVQKRERGITLRPHTRTHTQSLGETNRRERKESERRQETEKTQVERFDRGERDRESKRQSAGFNHNE